MKDSYRLSLVVVLALLCAQTSGYLTGGVVGGRYTSQTALAAGARAAEVRSVAGLDEGLKMRKLPGTDILVSEVCLGTMMFGEQVSKRDAIAQLDVATKVSPQYHSNPPINSPSSDALQHPLHPPFPLAPTLS
jgi:hypothetical protein